MEASDSPTEVNEKATPSRQEDRSWSDRLQDAAGRVWLGFTRFWRWAAYAIGSVVLFFILIGLIVSLLGGVYGGGNAANESRLYGEGLDKVAVVSIEGVIGEAGSSVVGGPVGVDAEMIRRELNQAADDGLVKAVVLRINSPGGSAVVSDQIFQHIVDFKNDSGKPVVASMGDTAASGGYYVAAAADRIVANPSTLTGSIGVIMQYFNAQGLLSNVGVSAETIKSGPYKDIGSFTRDSTPAEERILQSIVDGAHEQFVQRVAEGRGMEEDKVGELADGRIYTGSQAVENSLVDELGNLDTAVDVAASLANIAEPTVVEYERGGFFESLLGARFNLTSVLFGGQLPSVNTEPVLQYRWMPY